MRILFGLIGLLTALAVGILLMGLMGAGLGYCLTRLLPLSLFQATVVAQIGLFGLLSIVVATAYVLRTVNDLTPDPQVASEDADWDDEDAEHPAAMEMVVTEHRLRSLVVPPRSPAAAAPRRAARTRSPGTKKA